MMLASGQLGVCSAIRRRVMGLSMRQGRSIHILSLLYSSFLRCLPTYHRVLSRPPSSRFRLK